MGEGGAAGRGERSEKNGLGEQGARSSARSCPSRGASERESAEPAAPRDKPWCSAQIHLSSSSVCVWLASQ